MLAGQQHATSYATAHGRVAVAACVEIECRGCAW